MKHAITIALLLTLAACSATPQRPTPPQIDPSEFRGMSPKAYEAMVDYNRATWAYVRELEGRR